jgi:hypothetical protein
MCRQDDTKAVTGVTDHAGQPGDAGGIGVQVRGDNRLAGIGAKMVGAGGAELHPSPRYTRVPWFATGASTAGLAS